MKDKKTFYITTPIYYINDVPHIGHAYCTIGCDILARYKRLRGYDAFFLTGSDENSQKTTEAAEKAGKEVQAYTDEMSEIWQEAWKKLEITNDDYIRTTQDRHKKAVLKLFEKIYKKGDIYKGKYQGHYCKKCEAFYKETDLDHGICPQHLTKCEIIEEENYFFKLSKYQDQLLKLYQENPDFILPEYRKKEVVSFVKGGLEDISISRVGQKWGIPLPKDKNHVFYVWFDALINYISGIGYGTKQKLKYWPVDHHVLGKDIVRFHCVIWPAMLMAAEEELPKSLFVHGFFTINGLKISKSLGNAIDPIPIAERFGRDAMRYYLFAEFAFGQDGDFSFESLAKRNNTELADDLGNLLSRTVAMTEKFLEGNLEKGKWVEKEDGPLKKKAQEIEKKLDRFYDRLEFSKLLDQIWKLFRLANKYAEDQKPWALAKDPAQKDRLKQVLYNLAEVLRFGSYAFRPIMPETADKILEQLGVTFQKDYEKALEWDGLGKTKVQKKDALFPKIELKEDDPFFSLGKEKVEAPKGEKESKKQDSKKDQPEKKAEGPKAEASKAKALISYDDFVKLDIRIGKVLEAEKVKKAKKLLKLKVDLGSEQRQIIAGIALSYEPEDLIGKHVTVLTNLEPRKIMGLESQGMLLAGSEGDKVVVLTPEKEISPGSGVS